jgi:endonuclease/exonuclease/phosphatase (EEP) superfamily protein YafD
MSAWGYLLVALGAAVLLWGFGDRWWPATLLLFGPRWVLLLPALGLLPWAALRGRTALLPLMLALLTVVGPVMGLRTGWRSWFVRSSPDDLRIVTFNVAGGEALSNSPKALAEEWSADLVALQECGPRLAEYLAQVEEWHTDAQSGLCLMSRFPIQSAVAMDREGVERAGGSGLVVRYEIGGPLGSIALTQLHLDTPRDGLSPIREGRVIEGVERLRGKETLREIESRSARRWINEFPGPQIVLGDFNTPPESLIYRRYWGDFENAFSRAGLGFGGTRLNGWIRVRIDHVLVSGGWRVTGARAGDHAGSDHRPVIVDLQAPR